MQRSGSSCHRCVTRRSGIIYWRTRPTSSNSGAASARRGASSGYRRGGPSECVPSDPTATSTVVVKALCDADQFNPNFYDVRSSNQLTRAVPSPLVGTMATLLRENHSEDDLDTSSGTELPENICSA